MKDSKVKRVSFLWLPMIGTRKRGKEEGKETDVEVQPEGVSTVMAETSETRVARGMKNFMVAEEVEGVYVLWRVV